MAAVTHGMNPDEVEALGQQLKQMASQISDICGQLNSKVNSTTWVGPDANMFKGDWWPQHQQHLNKVSQDLDGFGQSALNNASEQRNVSGH